MMTYYGDASFISCSHKENSSLRNTQWRIEFPYDHLSADDGIDDTYDQPDVIVWLHKGREFGTGKRGQIVAHTATSYRHIFLCVEQETEHAINLQLGKGSECDRDESEKRPMPMPMHKASRSSVTLHSRTNIRYWKAGVTARMERWRVWIIISHPFLPCLAASPKQ